MATITEKTAATATLMESTAQLIQLTNPSPTVRVTNNTGTDAVYFTVNGLTTATVGGNNNYVVPAGIGSIVVPVPQPIFPGSTASWSATTPAISVSVISAGAENVTVSIF
jgi:hypothetical protein